MTREFFLASVAEIPAYDPENEQLFVVNAQQGVLMFTPEGKKVLVANEGEPNEGYAVDPEGSVSIVDPATKRILWDSGSEFERKIAALFP
jgi:hypothetical protein